MKRVSRRKLRTLCIDGISIEWGKTLTNISYGEGGQGLTACFTDGSTYEGDVLIGADGPRSKVRELLLGAEKARSKPLGVVQNTTLVKYGDAEKALHVRSGNPLFYLGYNPDGIVNFVSSKSYSHSSCMRVTSQQQSPNVTAHLKSKPFPAFAPRRLDLHRRYLLARRARRDSRQRRPPCRHTQSSPNFR